MDVIREFNLKRKTSNEYSGKCPLPCGKEAGTDRFNWNTETKRYFCRGCNTGEFGCGDEIDILRQVKGMTWEEACAEVGKNPRDLKNSRRLFAKQHKYPKSLRPERNEEFVYNANRFFNKYKEREDEQHKTYLLDRGISEELISTHVLTLNHPIPFMETRIMDGITIPTIWNGDVVGFKTRRNTYPKYVFAKGSKNYLNQIAEPTKEKIVLCEGEVDALSIATQCPDLSVACTGGSNNARHDLSLFYLLGFKEVIILPDNDKAGNQMAEWFSYMLPFNSRVIRLDAKDPNEFILNGGRIKDALR